MQEEGTAGELVVAAWGHQPLESTGHLQIPEVHQLPLRIPKVQPQQSLHVALMAALLLWAGLRRREQHAPGQATGPW